MDIMKILEYESYGQLLPPEADSKYRMGYGKPQVGVSLSVPQWAVT